MQMQQTQTAVEGAVEVSNKRACRMVPQPGCLPLRASVPCQLCPTLRCHLYESAFSASAFFPSHLATTGVSATVGGNRTGDSALCAAYAMATVPTRSLVLLTWMPTLPSKADTSTPVEHPRQLLTRVQACTSYMSMQRRDDAARKVSSTICMHRSGPSRTQSADR